MPNIKGHIQLTAKFYDQDHQLYYDYRLGVVDDGQQGFDEMISSRLKDFQEFIQEIWPYLSAGKPKEEFLTSRGEEWLA